MREFPTGASKASFMQHQKPSRDALVLELATLGEKEQS